MIKPVPRALEGLEFLWLFTEETAGARNGQPGPTFLPAVKQIHNFTGNFFLFFFFQRFYFYLWDRERQSMNGGGAEREGDTESETGSRL